MGKRKARNRQNKSNRIDSRKRIVISTEGSETEPKYIDALRQKYHQNVNVRVLRKGRKSDLMSVLGRLDKERKPKNDDTEYWAIFDHDRNDEDKLRMVFTKAKRYRYWIADSNPCFELWLLLHHNSLDRYKRLEASGDTAKCTPSSKALERIDPTYDPDKKGQWDASPYMEMIDTAIGNAERVDRSQPDEPLKGLGTRVYKLIESIRNSSPNHPRH